MDTKRAKGLARGWVESNRGQWPGLRAAHLVGGITTMADDEPFPADKDVDLHLIFDEGSPALRPMGPFLNVIEVCAGGIAIEAGIKSVADYRSVETVVANPEIAHHLTMDSLLYDPAGLLGALRVGVRREYPRRQWVLARIDYERHGLAGALQMRPMAAGQYGASGEANLLGYATTFLTAALGIAALDAPRIGSRSLLRLREMLAASDRLDLYDDILALLGLQHVTPARVEQLLREGAEAFDLAVAVRRTPHPFQHKLHDHLRPYFVASSQRMLDEGHHREALCWVLPFALSATDVILVDGPEAERARFAERQAAFLRELGLHEATARDDAFQRLLVISEEVFALARETAVSHPAVVNGDIPV